MQVSSVRVWAVCVCPRATFMSALEMPLTRSSGIQSGLLGQPSTTARSTPRRPRRKRNSMKRAISFSVPSRSSEQCDCYWIVFCSLHPQVHRADREITGSPSTTRSCCETSMTSCSSSSPLYSGHCAPDHWSAIRSSVSVIFSTLNAETIMLPVHSLLI